MFVKGLNKQCTNYHKSRSLGQLKNISEWFQLLPADLNKSTVHSTGQASAKFMQICALYRTVFNKIQLLCADLSVNCCSFLNKKSQIQSCFFCLVTPVRFIHCKALLFKGVIWYYSTFPVYGQGSTNLILIHQ